MANLVNFSDLYDYEEFRLTDREHIGLMLQILQREQVPVYLLFTDDRPIETHIVSIDADRGETLLAYSDELAKVERLNLSGIFVVADHNNTQLQYHVDAMAQILDGDHRGFIIPLPNKLYLIQRRASPRLHIPESDQVVCTLTGADGQSCEYPVIDISHEGLALLEGEEELAIGDGALGKAVLHLPNARIELELTRANRIILYEPVQHRKQVRLGCLLKSMSDADRQKLDTYLRTLENGD